MGTRLLRTDILGTRKTSTSGCEPQRIDILTFAPGLVFTEAYEHRVMVDVGGLQVPFVSVDDLRTNKLATGRLRYRADASDLPSPADDRF